MNRIQRIQAWLRFKVVPLKGYTAYEWQCGPWVLRIVHLTGGWFTWWAPWRRITLKKY